MSAESYFYFIITVMALCLALMVIGMLFDKNGFTIAGAFAALVIIGAPAVLEWTA